MASVNKVILLAFLCLRRGVSAVWALVLSVRPLFSAYAEVFPATFSIGLKSYTFLCLRRGVSSSSGASEKRFELFSAYAEVFPNPL